MAGDLWREILFGLRQFRRSPGLAAGVALTIGLGVGANLAIVALLSDIFFPSTPYRDSSRLVMVENTGPYFFGGGVPEGLTDPRMSMPDFEDFRAGQRGLSSVGAFSDGHVSVLTGTDRPRSVCRVFVDQGLFQTLGAAPLQGRLLGPGDFAPGAPPAALVTDGLWRTAFGADPGTTGRQVRLDEQPFTIVGIIPASTFGLLQPREKLLDEGRFDRCVVTALAPGSRGESDSILKYQTTQRDSPALRVLGRVRPAQTIESADRDVTGLGSRIREQNKATNAKRGLRAVSLDLWRTAGVRPLLLMLAAAAALAFLVACANAAGLVLTDTIRRQAELGLRQALGAGAAQLVGVVLTRAVLWSLPGALLGLLFAEATIAAIRWGASAGADHVAGVAFGPSVIGAGLALTLLAGLATGAVAAWTLRRRNLVEALREGGQTTSGGRRSHRVTFGLVAVQVAAATALTFGAALLLRSMWNVVSADRGFDIDKGFVVQVRLPRSKYPKAADNADYFRRALGRLRAMPEVKSAGVSVSPPLTDTAVGLGGDMEVTTPSGKKTFQRLSGAFVTPGYFESVGMRLVRGRFFSVADEQTRAAVIVVDESFRRTYLGDADPLACTLKFGSSILSIVGVVGDIRQLTEQSARRRPSSMDTGTAYLLYERFGRPPAWSFLVVSARNDPGRLADAAMKELLLVDNAACLDDPRTFSQLFARKVAERRRILGLVGGFAGIVLLITALSLTSALAQFVASHAHDLAIRRALGASRARVLAFTSRHLALALGVGLATGAAGSAWLGNALTNQLFGIVPWDLPTIAMAVAGLVVLAVVAAAGPLWRASRVDPARALRAL
jgi:putative ABC transport system permease protein